MKSVALAILGLARDGVQVFVATHSLFLLRELEILSKTDDFGMSISGTSPLRSGTTAYLSSRATRRTSFGRCLLLDENLQQSDRYLCDVLMSEFTGQCSQRA